MTPKALSTQSSIPAEDQFFEQRQLASLTPREREILVMFCDGLTSKEIAVQLNVSPRTAEAHRWNIGIKLGIHNVALLVRWACRVGLIKP